MILDIHGKKLVFGMQWRTLTGSNTPSALAANIAREVKAARIWHDDHALHMGYLDVADAQAKIKDKLYSGAAVLARVPELVPNALFVFRLEAAGQPAIYLVCGIVKGRPRVGFDQVVHDEKTLAQLAADFPAKCDGEFKLVGNTPELLSLLLPERRIAHVPYTLDMLVSHTGPTALLKKPRATSQRKRMLTLVVLALTTAVGWPYGKAEYDAYQRRLHPPPPQKSPAERYAEDLAARAAGPVALAGVALPAWAHWFANDVPLQVGGWSLANIHCDSVVTPTANCTLTYEIRQNAKGLTNQTFVAALPDQFGAPVFQANDTKALVSAPVPVGEARNLGTVLDELPTAMALRVGFGSQLQTLRPVASKAELKDLTIFGTVPSDGPGSITHPVHSAPWEIGGPLRNVTEFAAFALNITVKTIDLMVNLEATPDLKQSKFMLTVSGDAFARD
ncbi:ATPase (plasmid) [Cupriavidus necator]|uniref:ATPase n=1 Tax=Cupriavidus necator TaxID=106590 RepID=A0A1U9V3E9_CUPNE|nr:type 4b pilus protein PilO2 [Cupriavidus necator]AQV99472.1 ATPase [Cupriavidus necator]